jgi:hypothetical protein
MKKVFTLFLFLALGTGCLPRDWKEGVVFDHVVTIILENANYGSAMKDPYLSKLARRGAFLKNYWAPYHPSYPNYLALVGGKYFPLSVFDQPHDYAGRTIADLLEYRALTWKNYAEGFPGNCYLGSQLGRYVRRHVPLINFTYIQNDPARCANIVPGEQFAVDAHAGNLPNYSFYSPNMDDDGHDTSLAVASQWLEGFLEPILADPVAMKRTLIMVTFDESESLFTDHIYAVLLGPSVKTGFESKKLYSHFNWLRTVEENFQTGTLGRRDEAVAPILDVWSPEALREAGLDPAELPGS